MSVAQEEQQLDSLASLEERISRAVELVVALRNENQVLSERLRETEAQRDEARSEAQSASSHSEKMHQELEELRSERKQVRARIEKLLGQMDLLSAAG